MVWVLVGYSYLRMSSVEWNRGYVRKRVGLPPILRLLDLDQVISWERKSIYQRAISDSFAVRPVHFLKVTIKCPAWGSAWHCSSWAEESYYILWFSIHLSLIFLLFVLHMLFFSKLYMKVRGNGKWEHFLVLHHLTIQATQHRHLLFGYLGAGIVFLKSCYFFSFLYKQRHWQLMSCILSDMSI